MTAIELRPATPADSEFCFRLHKAAMGGYIAAIWGWDEQRQRGFQDRSFNPDRWQIIIADGADVGMIDVERRPTEIYLSRIEILPDYQGRGIGTRLVRYVEAEVKRSTRDTEIHVHATRNAETFYAANGYERLPVSASASPLFITMRTQLCR